MLLWLYLFAPVQSITEEFPLDRPIPLRRLPPLRYALKTDEACQALRTMYHELNFFLCDGGLPITSREISVLSRNAKYCDRDYCDASFECEMISDFDGCTRDFMQHGLGGTFYMKCAQAPKTFVWVDVNGAVCLGLAQYTSAALRSAAWEQRAASRVRVAQNSLAQVELSDDFSVAGPTWQIQSDHASSHR